jgi:glycosyltransferase involved in cell wall biosynthesis
VIAFAADWSLPLPSYEALELHFPSLREVLAEVEAARPDVIQLATPGPVGLSGLAAAKLLGIPVLGSYHTELGSYALKLTKDLIVAESLEAYVRWFYRQCTAVVAPTHAIADALVERGFGERPFIWGRGVDTGLLSPLRRNDEIRARLLATGNSPAPGEVLLLYVGRLSEEKRVSVLLEAFARLQAELPAIRLAVVGNGPAAADFAAVAPTGVTFLGELRREMLAQVYASADIFCFPSTTDTFGQVLLEAAASGLPAVAAAAGGAPELVRDGETGLLVPPNDAFRFAAAICELALQPGRRSELGAAARTLALKRTWQASYDELRHAYAVAAAPTPVSMRTAHAVS